MTFNDIWGIGKNVCVHNVGIQYKVLIRLDISEKFTFK